MARELLLKKKDQQYASIEKVLGEGHFQVRTVDKSGDQKRFSAAVREPMMRQYSHLREGNTVLLLLGSSDGEI
ncbi:hypothetical protein F4779DRAFT_623922 [Xylariaceae sp. FL0662B]|nr:hypothetical protein F4779DRAFT_623922 [Xylariaceae sp. FL0662B]